MSSVGFFPLMQIKESRLSTFNQALIYCFFVSLIQVLPALASISPIKVALIITSPAVEADAGLESERGLKSFLGVYPGLVNQFKIQKFVNPGGIAETIKIMERAKELGISYVVGISRSEDAVAAAQYAEENKMLYITPSATNSRITRGMKRCFQMGINDTLQGAALARFALIDLKRKRILILKNSTSIYSEGLSDSFEAVVSQKTGISHELHLYSTNDFKLEELKNKINRFKPDMVFAAEHIPVGALLAKVIHQIDPMIPFLAGEGFSAEKSLREALDDSPKIRVYYSAQYAELLPYAENQRFLKQYRKLFPYAHPTAEAALTYDAFFVLGRAFAISQKTISPQWVANFIKSSSFDLTTGRLSYRGQKQNTPVKDVLIWVSNAKEHRMIKRMRATWNPRH